MGQSYQSHCPWLCHLFYIKYKRQGIGLTLLASPDWNFLTGMSATLEVVKIKAEKYIFTEAWTGFGPMACAMRLQALFLQLPDVRYLSPIVHLYTISNVSSKSGERYPSILKSLEKNTESVNCYICSTKATCRVAQCNRSRNSNVRLFLPFKGII